MKRILWTLSTIAMAGGLAGCIDDDSDVSGNSDDGGISPPAQSPLPPAQSPAPPELPTSLPEQPPAPLVQEPAPPEQPPAPPVQDPAPPEQPPTLPVQAPAPPEQPPTPPAQAPAPSPDLPVNPGPEPVSCPAGGNSSGTIRLPVLEEAPVPHHHDHDQHGHGEMHAEHMAALALVSYNLTTHAAVNSGEWCDPATWHNMAIPGNAAHVVIPRDVTVYYNVMGEASLNTVRVDGTLEFSTSQSSRMLLDTLFVSPGGSLLMGTTGQPVRGDVSIDIVIADNGDINVNRDPMLLGRGILSHGLTRIHGEQKTVHLKVDIDPRAGDDVLTLAHTPENWRVGDTVVIAGTRYSGWKHDNTTGGAAYHGTEDEVRTITAVNGNRVTLDAPLEHDHSTPRSDLKTSVANYSRNITFRNEREQDLAVHRRGHVMFMHNQDMDVRYAAFHQLGRTDKSRPTREIRDIRNVAATSNARGRYSFHIHRTGLEDERNPAMAVGNAVFGSPGWGYVHHDSHAEFYDNASFDTHGAGFVSETGNETGVWVRNIAIKAKGRQGTNPKNNNDIVTFDIASSGAGFWFQSRMVRSIDNVAAGVTQGYIFLHRGSGNLDFDPDRFMLPEALGLGGQASSNIPPIRDFHGNEVFASTTGMFVVKANPRQGHDVMTVMSGFTAWEVATGADMEYTAHYLLKDFDLVAKQPERFKDPGHGINFGKNSANMIVRNARIQGFPEGLRLNRAHTHGMNGLNRENYVLIDNTFNDVATPLVNGNASVDTVIRARDLRPGRFAIDVPDPEPWNTTGGHSISFQGSKTDSVGTTLLINEPDTIRMTNTDLRAALGKNGYYRSDDGTAHTIIKHYFSDRASGEIHARGFRVPIGDSLDAAIQRDGSGWDTAEFKGSINLRSRPPEANGVRAETAFETETTIDVLANDTDPEGDALSVSGFMQPINGHVYANDDGTLTYRPGIGFQGTDTFYYWVTDNQGNFARADVRVDVTGR